MLEMDTTGNCAKAVLEFRDRSGILARLCSDESSEFTFSPSSFLDILLYTGSNQTSTGFHLHYYLKGR